jgi:hypothetical protein
MLLAGLVHADNPPLFAIEFGECDTAIEQWGRAALFAHFAGPVWQDFDEDDLEVLVVSEACRFIYDCIDPKQGLLVVVENPGWRGRKGDMVRVKWEPNRWQEFGDPSFKLVQLHTLSR